MYQVTTLKTVMSEFSYPVVQAYCTELTFSALAAMLFSSAERVKPGNKKVAKVLKVLTLELRNFLSWFGLEQIG